MKVDKRSVIHWIYLALFGLNVLVALLLRPVVRRKKATRVILYGHKLGGNLLAIYRQLRTMRPGVDVAFLTMDPAYHRQLRAQGESCLLAISPRSIGWLATAEAIITGHGLHSMSPMLHLSDASFFDVWHGIPYKGFDADDFRPQHHYDEIWVSSPLLKRIYVERFGFPEAMVEVTGYARTDRLVARVEEPAAVKRQLGLDPEATDRLVLFAPTWKQDSRSRSMFPFGVDEKEFFRKLSQLGERVGAKFLMRSHLNSGTFQGAENDRIVQLPYALFPDTEQVLLVSDILVCDWSSIAFDYLLLDRPTIFLDVEPPFAKGFTLDESYRFGAIASDMEQLLGWLESYLEEPARYRREFAAKSEEIKSLVYAGYADGSATRRCIARMQERLAGKRGTSRTVTGGSFR